MRTLKLFGTIALASALVLATLGPAAAAIDKAKLMDPDSLKGEKAPDTFKAQFETSKGAVVIEVHRDWAPLGADRFYALVKHGYYDGCRFFRVLPGFVAQFGINGDPALNSKWQPARIQDDPVKQSNKRGFLSFATGGPNTRTTQVFINFKDNTMLDGMGFSPFGEVVQGMDIVEKLFSGYGEGPPRGTGADQGRLQSEGNAYLEKDFPKFDFVKTATIAKGEGKTEAKPAKGEAKPAPATQKPQ